jgi:glutaredoxin
MRTTAPAVAGCPTCTSALRTIDKNGIEAVIADMRARGDKV